MPESVVNRCCGSRVTVPDSRKQVTGQFKRTQQGPVIHLLSVPSNHKDLMPPARIGDLQIKIHPKSKRSLEASWTAPGDDFDHGTVQGYKIVFSRNKSALLQHRGDYEILEEFQRPDNAGKATSYQFSFQHYFSDFHLGLVAFDERRNEGRMSNIVTVFLDSNDIAVPIKVLEDSADNQVSKAPQEQDDGVMIGILCGTFAVIGLLLWAGLYWVKNQKSSSTKNGGVTANLVSVAAHGGGEDNGHDTTSSDCELKPTPNSTTGASALKVLPVNGEENRLQPLMPQFSSIASGGPIGQYPGKGDNANTPTYWSASKLLDEHENRNIYSDGVVSQQNGPAVPSTTTYHHNYPKPLDPIVEDPEFLYGKIGDPSKTNATSTPIRNTTVQSPIKYANLTFPRRGQSVPPPSPVSDALPGSPNNSSYTLGRRGSHLLKSDGLYGYAQSEPPNGLYGTVQRTGRKIPPKIPPKPSLSALLGFPGKVGDSSDGGFMGDDVFLTTPQAGRKKSTLRENMIKAGEDSPAAVSGAVLDGNGVSVRNITHV